MIFTHCGKMGDFLLSWPVASYYHKNHNEKITFVLAKNLPFVSSCISLLKYQDFTQDVIVSEYLTDDFSMGGQPYKFDPSKFGCDGPYINIGFDEHPTEYVSEYYAKKTQLGVDYDYRIKIPEVQSIGLSGIKNKIIISNDHGLVSKYLNLSDEKYHVLDFSDDMAHNAFVCKNGLSSISIFSASCIMADLCDFQNHSYFIPWHQQHLVQHYLKRINNPMVV